MTRARRHCTLSIVIFMWSDLFFPFLSLSSFVICLQECRGSVILTLHTLNTYLGGILLSKPTLGYNPFEMQLSVITHRQSWKWAWLWGVTLPRCLAQPLMLPGLQQRLHTGILVLPLVCVLTNYPLKDGMESLAPLDSLPKPSISLFMSPSQSLCIFLHHFLCFFSFACFQP